MTARLIGEGRVARPDVAAPAASVGARLRAVRAREGRRIALWTPAALALGVAWYFVLEREPPPWLWPLLLLAAGALAAASRPFGRFAAWPAAALRVALVGAALAALGAAAAQIRTQSVAAPRVAAPVEGRVEGRLVEIRATSSGRRAAVLDRLAVEGLAAAQTPHRVRITLTGDADLAEMRRAVGGRIAVEARLFSPPEPAEPGAFDFRWAAWFDRLGALGVARAPPEILDATPIGVSGALARLRANIAERVRAAAPGVAGAVCAALLVGDRSEIPRETLDALRDSGLAHLLAISGLHMGLVCLTLFGGLRALLALWARPPFGVPAKKAAAALALLGGAAYLALSGGGVAPERAFIMAAVAFLAVLVDRPAITLRSVALAAIVILLVRPESLFAAGFQLSFAATAAMVAFFEATPRVWRAERRAGLRPIFSRWAAALLAASAIAGLATAPFAAAIFNRAATYGLLANLAATPAMGLWIMPFGLLAALLAPFGLDGFAIQAMALGVEHVLFVAETASSLPSARAVVQAPPGSVPPLLGLGLAWLVVWRGRALKTLGLAPLLAAAALWSGADRPDLLIAPNGRLTGVLLADGRAFDLDPTGRFAAEFWARRDGARRAPGAVDVGFARMDGGAWIDGPRFRVVVLTARRVRLTPLRAACAGAPRVVVLAIRSDAPEGVGVLAGADRIAPDAGAIGDVSSAPVAAPARPCVVLDRPALRAAGAIALDWPVDVAAPSIRAARLGSAGRPWADGRL